MSSAVQQPRLRIGIDTGGTFTDIVSVDSGSAAMRVTKVASTPTNPAIGLVRGVRAILEAAGGSPTDVAGLAHGTTVATNALLQGPISGLGLIVTSGFRHLLEIGRQSVPVGYGNFLFLGEAGAHRAAPFRARGRRGPEFPWRGNSPAGRGERARRRAFLPQPGCPRGRHLPHPLLCQSRP